MEDLLENSPSRIPTPAGRFRRTASVRVRGERPVILYSTSPAHFPSISEREEIKNWSTPNRFNLSQRSRSQASGLNKRDDDLDSLESYGSNVSGLSKVSTRSTCEHSPFAKNGTTFSARSNKYIVHCKGNCHGPEEYLTPTQRANQSIRRLKTLLQLAKEKLVEKEQEIFKLTKEVVELKVFKASIKNGQYSEASTPSDVKEDLPEESSGAGAVFIVDDSHCDAYIDQSPVKTGCCYENNTQNMCQRGKMSPTSPLHLREKMSATPDYLLSSLADSGNFDDLASSLSLQSKDSLNLQALIDEDKADGQQGEQQSRIVSMYEVMLIESKDAYENELRSVKLLHEEKSMQMVDDFEIKLKEAEKRYEERFASLLKTTEQEKVEIVERFEKRLQEEKKEYLTKMNEAVPVKCNENSESYLLRVEEEKAIYEQSLSDIKMKFELERQSIENSFDDAMAVERNKFEHSVEKIRGESDRQVRALQEKISELEGRYNDLLLKYNDSLTIISQLKEENKQLKSSLEQQQTKEREMYVKMCAKGQEAARLQLECQSPEKDTPSNVPAPELLVQLKVTRAELENLKDTEYRAQNSDGGGACLLSAKEALSLWMLAARKAMYKRLADAQQPPTRHTRPQSSSEGQDPEAALQFLKSAVFYFLTDRDNHLEHLRAIENILGFSASERQNIHSSYLY